MELMEARLPWMPTVKMKGHAERSTVAISGDDGTSGSHPDWDVWRQYLSERTPPPALRKLLATRDETPILWCLTERIRASEVTLVRQLAGLKRKRDKKTEEFDWTHEAIEWLTQLSQSAANVSTLVAALAWAHALPRLAHRMAEKNWWQLLEALVDLSAQARAGHQGTILATQLAGGELALTLAYVLPELPGCFEARTRARQLVAESLLEATDGEGVLHASHFSDMRPLLACWTRCAALDTAIKKGKLGREARNQLDWLLRQALRFTRPDGSAVLSPPQDLDPTFATLIDAALTLSGDAEDRGVADCVLPGPKSRRSKALKTVVPDASEHSEWSELALLQTNFEPATVSCAVLYPQSAHRIELRHDERVLLSGPLMHHLTIDGKTLDEDPSWEEICWLSDQDVDYLELEADLGDGWRLQRQFLLSHDDEFFFYADAVLGERPADIRFQVQFPLADLVRLQPVAEHTELEIDHSGHLAGRIIPLGLSEWSSAARSGRWLANNSTLQHTLQGQALYVPLFFDLAHARRRQPLTWRQLTVAENLAIVSPDVAVGYRVQVGDEQWLFYRSLAAAKSRTVLGQNLGSDFFAARFGRDGEAEELVEIES